MALLEGNKDYMKVFYSQWEKSINKFQKVTPVFDNPNIVYSYADFDEHVLDDKNIKKLEEWKKELEIKTKVSAVDLYKQIVKKKKNPYKKLTEKEKTYFNRASWLSLKLKGEILIKSFKEQFLPKIKKVHATQLSGSIKSDDGQDSINGVLDCILEVEGYDKPIIIDLKTASQPYKEEQIDLTEQLTLYYGMMGAQYKTDLVGYLVLCKNIPKQKIAFCKSCGHERRTGQLKTCDNEINGKRCKGEWEEKVELKPEVQFMVRKKGDTELFSLYSDYSNIIYAMKNDMVYKNQSKCHNWYGGKCPFFDLCHKGDDSNLLKKGRKK